MPPVRSRTRSLGRLALLVLLAGSATALGYDLPKLPPPMALPQSGDSPGVVTFDHATHVDPDRPDCTVCHPKRFPIVKSTRRPAILHERMDRSQACGACHDGTKAFNRDDCTSCHRS